MARTTRRLSAEDWVEAGLRAMAVGGPDAVAIEPLAASLGATKGSGYWHWPSRRALLAAVMGRWHEVGTRDVIAGIEARGGAAGDRLRRLLALVTTAAEQRPGDLLTLADPDPSVREVVEVATAERVDYVAQLLRETGLGRAEARRRAVLAYAAYLGHAQLAATVPGILPRRAADRRALQRALVDAVTRP